MTEELKRLTVEVSASFHKDVKGRAARRGLSIKEYILGAISQFIAWEKKYEKPD